MQTFIEQCREWQRKNPDWQLHCDIKNSSKLYTQWEDLPKNEKMYWIGKYREGARECFEEFGLKKCKVEHGVLDCNMEMHSVETWPNGLAMTVYRTKINGKSVVN